MGGGGFLGLGPAPQAPAAPDYTQAAQATATGNLDAARAATAANRVNQVTPYGNLDYSITGQDPYGNPTWTANTSLSGVGQQLLNNQNQASLGLGSTINSALGRTQDMMSQGFNPNTNPITTNVGQANLQTNPNYASGMEGWDKANSILQARLQPQMDQAREQQNSALVNQGIPVGSKAYENAMRTFNQGQNDLLTNSQLAGQQIGSNLFNQGIQGGQFSNAANQQMFANQIANANLGNTAQQQQYNQSMTNYNMPLNTLSALRSGSQVQNPTFINAPQQATTSGADILGASQMGYNAQMGGFNAANAAQSNFNSGLMGLGGTLGAAALMAPASDIRMKENIEKVGKMANGLNVYTYEYKPEFRNDPFAGHGKHIGVMAHEVEEVMPEAVITRPDGYKMVNYGALNG